MKIKWFHMVCYYVAWTSCIVLAAKGYGWLSFFVVSAFTIIQWWMQSRYADTQFLWLFMMLLTTLGFLVDTFFMQIKVIDFHSNPWPHYFSPPWMIGIWANFSLLLYACLKQYFYYYGWFGLLSFIGFPLAYWAGVSLGAAVLLRGDYYVIFFGLVWSCLLPLIMYLYQHITKY